MDENGREEQKNSEMFGVIIYLYRLDYRRLTICFIIQIKGYHTSKNKNQVIPTKLGNTLCYGFQIPVLVGMTQER